MLHSNRPVGTYDIAELLGKAFLKCQTGEIATNGFKVTGIFPFNRRVFTDVDFAPSEDIDLEETTVETLRASKGQSVKNNTTKVTPTQNTVSPRPTPEHAAAARDMTPSAKDLAEAGPSTSSTVNFCHVSPQDILPIPKPKR